MDSCLIITYTHSCMNRPIILNSRKIGIITCWMRSSVPGEIRKTSNLNLIVNNVASWCTVDFITDSLQ